MVRHIFLTVIFTLSANAADIYDTNSGRYRSSVDIVKQTPNAGVLVNPDVSAIATIDVGNNKRCQQQKKPLLMPSLQPQRRNGGVGQPREMLLVLNALR